MRCTTLLGIIWIAGCSLVPSADAPPGLAEPQMVTDCVAPLAFEGETTLAALGLGDIPGVQRDANRRGTVRITQDTVAWEEFAPPDVPPAVAEGQMLCVTWPDGSGMAMLLDRPFPVDLAGGAGGAVPPVVVLVAGAVLVIVAGVSWIAFRRDPG